LAWITLQDGKIMRSHQDKRGASDAVIGCTNQGMAEKECILEVATRCFFSFKITVGIGISGYGNINRGQNTAPHLSK
jgi:hypothetical protein